MTTQAPTQTELDQADGAGKIIDLMVELKKSLDKAKLADTVASHLRNALQIVQNATETTKQLHSSLIGERDCLLDETDLAAVNRRIQSAIDLYDQENAPREALAACVQCGFDFLPGKLNQRRAKGHDVCLSCARDLSLELHHDDAADLSEDYWSSKADQ